MIELGNGVVRLTPQEIDAWRLEKQIAEMSGVRYPDKLPQAVCATVGPARPARYRGSDDTLSLHGGGRKRAVHLRLH